MSFFSDLIVKLTEWFVAKFIVEKVKVIEQDAQIAKSSHEDLEALKAAKSKEEKDAALKKIADHTFSNK